LLEINDCIARELIPVLEFWMKTGEKLFIKTPHGWEKQEYFTNAVKLKKFKRILEAKLDEIENL